jgi:hypothetical protein
LRLDSVGLEEIGKDRVRISGVKGEPPPSTLKVCLNTVGGYRNEVVFILTGLDIDEKAALVTEQLEARLAKKPPAEVRFTLARTDREDADTKQTASALLRFTAKDPDPDVVGRAISGAAVELAVASYPGFNLTAPPADAMPYGVYRPAYVDASLVPHVAVLPDGTRTTIAPSEKTRALEGAIDVTMPTPLSAGRTQRVPLGRVFGARSGDKGGMATLGVWARTDDAWRWLAHELTVGELHRLLPEAAAYPTTRHVFPKIRALNFVIDGLLGEGVSSSTRFDPQAKALGEWLRARHVELPEALL